MATHAGILTDGRIVDQGTKEALLARHDRHNLEGVFHNLVALPGSGQPTTLSFLHTLDQGSTHAQS